MAKSSLTPHPNESTPRSDHEAQLNPHELMARPFPLIDPANFQFHQGPIPMASEFEAYEKVLPGSADRILKMAEREQKASITLRRRDWWSEFISMILGKGFLYCLLGCTVYLIIKGKSVQALLTGIAPVASVIYSTLFGEKQSDQSNQE